MTSETTSPAVATGAPSQDISTDRALGHQRTQWLGDIVLDGQSDNGPLIEVENVRTLYAWPVCSRNLAQIHADRLREI